MYFMYDNLLEGYAITAESYSDLYPASNIIKRNLAEKWKGTDDDVDQRIVIDCGAAVAIQAIAILGHNFDVQTVKIEANATDSWGSPSFTYTFTSLKEIMWYIYSGTAYRYWSILIEDNDVDHIPEIAFLHFGNYLDIDTGISRSITVTPFDNSTDDQSDTGIQFTYDGIILYDWKVSFPYLSESQLASFKTMMGAIHKRPFVSVFDIGDSHTSFAPLWAKLSGVEINYVEQRQKWAVGFVLKECK